MATFQVVDEWANYVSTKRVDLTTDTFKAALTNTAPTKAGTQVLSDISQITSAGSYAVVTVSGASFAETGAGTGIWKFTSSPITWTASGGNFDTARYIVVYDDTHVNKPVVGYIDNGSSFTLNSGNSATFTPGASGLYTTTVS
jgi:hypothetical protein